MQHSEPTCAVDGCPKAAQRRSLCWGHIWQQKHHPDEPLKPLAPRGQSRRERHVTAALTYADADTSNEAVFARAEARLRMARLARKPRCTVARCNRRRYERGLCFRHLASKGLLKRGKPATAEPTPQHH
jgi:hypothetical protein